MGGGEHCLVEAKNPERKDTKERHGLREKGDCTGLVRERTVMQSSCVHSGRERQLRDQGKDKDKGRAAHDVCMHFSWGETQEYAVC